MTSIDQVDAFTSEAFGGNPAAVCLLTGPRDARWMQLVAREMNLSETAFVHPAGEAFSLRWFTPVVEVDLCGHATLASAHVLWERGILPPHAPARFDTRSGRLTATRLGPTDSSQDAGAWIELDFPATPDEEIAPPLGLIDAIGSTPLYVGRSKFDYLLELADERAVRNLAPDFVRLREFPARGAIVTARGDARDIDFVSRYFAPAFGIDEDPVTGSTHCCLGPYWARRLLRSTLVAHQLSARGGVIKVAMDGDRVRLAGQAVTVLRGELAEIGGELTSGSSCPHSKQSQT
jgi:PhzF family phenazine biosynthesis protein